VNSYYIWLPGNGWTQLNKRFFNHQSSHKATAWQAEGTEGTEEEIKDKG